MENKIPRFVKLIANTGANGVGLMNGRDEFEKIKGKIYNTSKDKPLVFFKWDAELRNYMYDGIKNYEECLPKKWYLKITYENKAILNEWRLKQPGCSMTTIRDISGFLLSKHEHDNSYYYDGKNLAKYYYDYEEITFEEFARLELSIIPPSLDFKPKLAFKGFNSVLGCRDKLFEIGVTYSLPNPFSRKPRLCSSDGYHYCTKLEDVFTYYSNYIDNRFCIIEILDEYNEDDKKGTTYSFRIIRELTNSELATNFEIANKFLDIEYEDYENKKKQRDEAEKNIKIILGNKVLIDKAVKEELVRIEQEQQKTSKNYLEKMAKSMRLDIVRKFQEQYPHTQIGGSVGLFLHGVHLNRFKNQINDFDIITPYYTKFETTPQCHINDSIENHKSGNDFTECLLIENIKADVRIDNKQKYDIIEFEGFKYKVSVLESIWAAKLRYNTKKHIDDLREAMQLS